MTVPQDRKSSRRSLGAPLDHAPEGVTYARVAAGLTKRSLASTLGISEQLMGAIEAGRRNAGPDLLAAMAAQLDCPLVVLQAKQAGAPPENKRNRPADEAEARAAPGP
ncbi:helix-turn-helix transcriptional regulator [Streptomyces sp. NPDC056831]|uniref:helix-turn-helix transcriptional regulator n=1 Tax=Streptomyces sp. NPDC056831 TaxID=3345954 RepID=UPI0036AA2E90